MKNQQNSLTNKKKTSKRQITVNNYTQNDSNNVLKTDSEGCVERRINCKKMKRRLKTKKDLLKNKRTVKKHKRNQ